MFYSPDYVAAQHSFDTTRKSAEIAESLRTRPIAGVELVAPEPLSEAELLLAHTARYVRALRTGDPGHLASSSGFPWDPGVWKAVRASNGGVRDAVCHVLAHGGTAGSLSSGLHHAKADGGTGFCAVNGLAIAALEAAAAGRRVLILDLDAHAGGGTYSIVRGDANIDQLDVTVAPFDTWIESGASALEIVHDARDYLRTIQGLLRTVVKGDYDVCIYNAGMDPHEDCMVGGLAGITTDVLRARESLVFGWAESINLPVAFALAGGYKSKRLPSSAVVNLHRLTIAAAARATAAVAA